MPQKTDRRSNPEWMEDISVEFRSSDFKAVSGIGFWSGVPKDL
jgi:hypothetical protein